MHSSSSSLVVTCSSDGTVRLWSLWGAGGGGAGAGSLGGAGAPEPGTQGQGGAPPAALLASGGGAPVGTLRGVLVAGGLEAARRLVEGGGLGGGGGAGARARGVVGAQLSGGGGRAGRGAGAAPTAKGAIVAPVRLRCVRVSRDGARLATGAGLRVRSTGGP